MIFPTPFSQPFSMQADIFALTGMFLRLESRVAQGWEKYIPRSVMVVVLIVQEDAGCRNFPRLKPFAAS
jgi:hypothetical protein